MSARSFDHIHLGCNGHDCRVCWQCNGRGLVARSVSLRVTERTLRALGWRYIGHWGGRMVCPQCKHSAMFEGVIL